MTIKQAEECVARVAKVTGLPVVLDTNNPGDGRIYRMELKGRVLVRSGMGFKAFQRMCEAFADGFDECERAYAEKRADGSTASFYTLPDHHHPDREDLSAREIREFDAYLANCTDRQVQGVYDKECAAHREPYKALVEREAQRRGMVLS